MILEEKCSNELKYATILESRNNDILVILM